MPRKMLPENDLSIRRRSHFALTALLTVGFLLGATSGPAWSQEEGDEAGDPDAAAAAEEPNGLERLIYLPYKNLKEVFDAHGSTVFMSYGEYVKRWREQRKTESSKTPVEAVITESHYTARVDQSLLRIDADLTIQVLGKPWVELPVRFGKAAVGKLTVEDGAQILLRGTGNGTYALLFGAAGEHKVRLELAVPIQTSPDGRQAAFDVPAVGVTTFELAVPKADQTVEVSPQLISIPVDSADGETRIKANLGSTTSIRTSWHPRTSIKPDMDLLAAVSNSQRISVRDGLVHTDAWIEYEVLRGEMSQLSIAVPKDHRILGVTSDNARIRGVKTEPGEQHQMTVVEFLTPVTGKVTIEVHTEHEFADGSIGLAGRTDDGDYLGIHSLGAVRESGFVTVTSASDLSLQFEEIDGLGRIEEADVPERIRQPSAASFKFFSSDVRLRALAKPVEPRLTVKSTYRYTFQEDELELDARLGYTIERAGVFELNVKVPDGLEIDDVRDSSGGPLVREFHVEGDDEKTLRIVLQSRSASEATFNLTIEAHVEFADASDTIELTLPIPEPLGIEREVADVLVLAEDALEVITSQDDVVSAQPMPLGGTQREGRHRVASGWTFNRRPVEIPVRTERRPTRLTASVATTVNVKEETIELSSVVTFNVQFAGIDTFRIAVPEAVSDKVSIDSLEGGSAPDIQQQVADEEAQDGWITHTIRMQRDVTGTHRFQVIWDLTASDEEGAAESERQVVVEPVRVLGLEESDDSPDVKLSDLRGEVVVQNERSLSVAAEPLDETIEAIDVRELTLLEQNGAIAFRYFRQPVALKVESTKREIQKVVETVVMKSLVEIVTRRDTSAGYRCRYWIKSSERQRLRIDVPIESELLGVFINGQAVNPERNSNPGEAAESWDSYFVNVARSAASDQPFGLVLQMMTPIADSGDLPFDGVSKNQVLRLPQIGGVGNPGVAVQELNTVIWVPEDYELVGDADGFVNESKLTPENAMQLQPSAYRDWLDTDAWIGVEPAGFIDFPTEGNRFRYSNLGGAAQIKVRGASRSTFTWILSGAILLFALLLRNVPWDHKLLIVLIVAFVGALAALSAQGWVTAILAAARFGIYSLIVIWILHSIFTWRSGRPTEAAAPSEPQTALQTASGAPAVIPPPGVFDDLREQFGK